MNINISDYHQSRINNQGKHAWWSFFPKKVSRYLYFFQKISIADVWLGSKCASVILSTPPSYFCVRIIKTSRFLFLLPLHSMYWSLHLFLCILWVVYQTVLNIVLLFHIIFFFLTKSVLPSWHLFLCFIFISKIVAANDSTFKYLPVFFEVFLFHEIRWTKYQKVLIFSSRYFME